MDTEGKIVKAKINILENSIFFSTILFSLVTVVTKKVKTAAVDGTTMFFNPDFVEELSHEELVGLTMHELYHVIYGHITRRGDRDSKKYNYAGDYAINIHLTDDGFTIPAGGLLDEQYRDMTTEAIYDALPTQEQPGWGGDDILEPADEKEKDEAEQKITEILSNAIMASDLKDAGGEVPADVRAAIEKLLNPILDWKVLLADYVREHAKDDYSWSKPNKRYLPDFYLPSQYSETIKHMVVAIDTSGSVSDEETREYLSEIENMRQTYQLDKLTLYAVDTAIRSRIEIGQYDNLLDQKLKGGGGTQWDTLFSELSKKPPTVMVMFSDMCVYFDFPKPKFDVIYINTYSNFKAPVGYGKTIIMNQN